MKSNMNSLYKAADILKLAYTLIVAVIMIFTMIRVVEKALKN